MESQKELPKAQDRKVISRTIIVQSPEDEAEVERLMSEIQIVPRPAQKKPGLKKLRTEHSQDENIFQSNEHLLKSTKETAYNLTTIKSGNLKSDSDASQLLKGSPSSKLRVSPP